MCRKWLRYDPETGKLYWNTREPSDFYPSEKKSQLSMARSWNSANAGREAFTAECKAYSDKSGYKFGSINGCPTTAHRVIWMIFHDDAPVVIDHINGDRGDNRIVNLRNTDNKGNSKNRRNSGRNTSGQAGVDFWTSRQMWRARVWSDGKAKYLGYFNTKQEAIDARKAAELTNGYHENHGHESPKYKLGNSPLEEFMLTFPECDYKTAKMALEWFSRVVVYNDIRNSLKSDQN